MYQGYCEPLLRSRTFLKRTGKAQLIFTSPPFVLNRKKKYGNLEGRAYVRWIARLAELFKRYVAPDGSIVIELGNAWEPGQPTMSTLAMEALLAFKKRGGFHLCQEFICFNPARLPSPAQWVNVQRCRVKDSFTRIWWLSPSPRPKADNRRVLVNYSDSMRSLLRRGTYNSGTRPSEHHIGGISFLADNGGAIPPNVLVPDPMDIARELGVAIGPVDLLSIANTGASDPYQTFCRQHGVAPHPARMPVKLASFFIEFLTTPNDMVLDPFGGSNTTGYAAESLGRRWTSIEADQNYVLGSRARFSTLTEDNTAHPAPSIPRLPNLNTDFPPSSQQGSEQTAIPIAS
jgi:site-specific DNA-methyltransferase (cytosine-N4-specific)